jgi:hypothetical protein
MMGTPLDWMLVDGIQRNVARANNNKLERTLTLNLQKIILSIFKHCVQVQGPEVRSYGKFGRRER